MNMKDYCIYLFIFYLVPTQVRSTISACFKSLMIPKDYRDII